MKDLFRSEWRRFRRLALIVALGHGLALLLMSRVVDLPELGYENQGMTLALYMLLGLTLALLQIGSYRKTSRWLWLIHRPLPPARIFAALALSALALLSVAVLAPPLVFFVATDAFTTQVVDSRHYVALFLALAFTMMAWLAGAHACTSRHKAAVAVLIAPLILALHLASVWWLLLPVLACLAWLVFVARHSFRADRDAPIARHGVLLLTALPLQLGFFLLLFHLSKTGVAVVKLLGRSGPGRTVLATDTDIDVEAYLRNLGVGFFAKGLEAGSDPRVASWREQLPLLKMAGTTADIERFPVRHQFGNLAQPWWDEKRNIKWTFSHDRMQFHGRDPRSGAASGWWGTGGVGSPNRFADVPSSGSMTRTTLYAVDDETQRQYELVHLPAGEWFTGKPVHALDRLLLRTNRRLLVYRPDLQALSPFAPLKLDWQLPFAVGEPAPVQVDVAELLDGWLVSLFYFDGREFDGFMSVTHPWQQVVHVDADGRTSVVGERREIHDHSISMGGSAAVPVASWWVSPPFYALAHVPDLLDTGLAQPPRFEPLPKVPLFYPLALGLMLISLAGGYAWLRGTQAGRFRRRLWLASCALLGVPAFLSLICLEPRRTRALSLPSIRRRAQARAA